MATESEPNNEPTHWYVMQTNPRAIEYSGLWVFFFGSMLGFLLSFFGLPKTWAGSLVCLFVAVSAWTGGRRLLIAAALEDGQLLLYRFFFNRLEQLPLSRLRSARLSRGTNWLLLPESVQLYTRSPFPLSIHCFRNQAPPLERETWERFKSDLKRALGDRWKE